MAVGYCLGAHTEGTDLRVPKASQGWRALLFRPIQQCNRPFEGVVVMGKVAQASDIQGTLPVRGMGKCCWIRAAALWWGEQRREIVV